MKKSNEVVQVERDGKQIFTCDCGATATLSERKRFMTRHPSMCNARQKLAHELAQGTRSVEDE